MAPQDRKTVACNELEQYFEKDPHPDGKTMGKLATKLGLNKKQVSNFFERSRRKAGIVVEPRRKSSSCASSVTSSSTASSKAKKQQAASTPSDPITAAITTGGRKAPAATVDKSASATAASRKRTSRGALKVDYEEHADDEEDEDGDIEGLSAMDLDDTLDNEEEDDDDDLDGQSSVLADADEGMTPQTPAQAVGKADVAIVSSGIPDSAASTYRIAASRYQTRRAGPVEHIPLPTSGLISAQKGLLPLAELEDTGALPSLVDAPVIGQQRRRNVGGLLVEDDEDGDEIEAEQPEPKKTRTTSASATPSSASPGRRSRSSHKRSPKVLVESPTVQFLRNPFPTPVASPSAVVAAHPGQTTRRQARKWFGKPEPVPATPVPSAHHALQAITGSRGNDRLPGFGNNPLPSPGGVDRSGFTNDKVQLRSQTQMQSQPARPVMSAAMSRTGSAITAAALARAQQQQLQLQHRSRQPQTSRQWAHEQRAAERPVLAPLEDDEAEIEIESSSELESAYDEDEMVATAAAKRRPRRQPQPHQQQQQQRASGETAPAADKKAGASLRTTIACSELRVAFLANPHPAANVLDALATRLGLGKKQVSNYFVRERKKAGYQIKVRHGLNAKRKSNKAGGGKKTAPVSSAPAAPIVPAFPVAQAGSQAAPPPRPRVVVTQHDEAMEVDEGNAGHVQVEPSEVDAEGESDSGDEFEEEEEYGSDDAFEGDEHLHNDNIPVPTYHAAPALVVGDDLPELSYDDVASLRSENLSMHDRSCDYSLGSISDVGMLNKMSGGLHQYQHAPYGVRGAPASTMMAHSHSQQSSLPDEEEVPSPPFAAVSLLPSPYDAAKARMGDEDMLMRQSGHGYRLA